MRHRHRLSAQKLLLEQRSHAPRRSNHVRQPHRGAPHGAGLIQHHQLRDPLGRPHDAVRCHCLVRGNQYHRARAMRRRRFRHSPRAQRVRFHRRHRIPLHQRHVLQRRGVQHHLRPVLLEQPAQQRGIAHAAQHRRAPVAVTLPHHFRMNAKQRLLGRIQQNHPSRAARRQPPHHLRADKPAGPGNQHTTACGPSHADCLHSRRRAPQNLRPGGGTAREISLHCARLYGFARAISAMAASPFAR